MSNEADLSDLRKRHDEAWAAFKKQLYEAIEPHFYREKRGRKLEHIFPWKSLDERVVAESKAKELYDEWFKLMQAYWKITGEHLPVAKLYVKEETPNGDRWKKV